MIPRGFAPYWDQKQAAIVLLYLFSPVTHFIETHEGIEGCTDDGGGPRQTCLSRNGCLIAHSKGLPLWQVNLALLTFLKESLADGLQTNT